jgi:ABC-2 type transport system ATP-binding protein
MNTAIEIINVKKQYGSLNAVDGISLKIPYGRCFGLLGPNGAGKTTLVEMIEGIIPITSGEIKVFGEDVTTNLSKIQPKLGVQLQENAYFNFLNVEQIIGFFQELCLVSSKGKKLFSMDEILDMTSLANKKKSKVSQLSGGQKQRLSIGLALLGNPEIVFLDEPTASLDPQNRLHLWTLVEKLKTQKKTIVLTTHNMEEAEKLCEELAIVDHGKVILQGNPHDLIRSLNKYHSLILRLKETINDDHPILNLQGVLKPSFNETRNELKMFTEKPVDTMKQLFEAAETHRLNIVDFHTDQAGLEDVFLLTVGEGLRE